MSKDLSNANRIIPSRDVARKSFLFDFLAGRYGDGSVLWENERFPGETLEGFICAVDEGRGHIALVCNVWLRDAW
jgi:hypothetical protein